MPIRVVASDEVRFNCPVTAETISVNVTLLSFPRSFHFFIRRVLVE
jgi:hypothetical protein